MTTHDRDKIIAAAIGCIEGPYDRSRAITITGNEIERLYAIAFAAGVASRDAEIEELAAALESLIDMDVAYQRGRKVVEAVENACAVLAKVRKP